MLRDLDNSEVVEKNISIYLQNTKGALKKARRRRLKRQRLLTKTEVNDNGLLGILEIRRITPYDTGNYSCVPSYALPDWAQVHIVHGKIIYIGFLVSKFLLHQ
jgi:hypothetical protein